MSTKFLFTLLLFLVWSGAAVAQSGQPSTLTGVLTDSLTTQPVSFATVALKDGTKRLIGTTTDEKGSFTLTSLPLGNYALVVSYVGYRTTTLPISLTGARPVLELGAMRLAAESKTLSEVTVSGQKALVEDTGDRLVYNAEKDISNAGARPPTCCAKCPRSASTSTATCRSAATATSRCSSTESPRQ